VGRGLLGALGDKGAPLLLLALFLVAVTLATGLSWFKVADLTGAKAGKVIVALPSDPVRKIIQLMKEKGISQLPVCERETGDGLVGIITEVALLNYMLEGEHRLDAPIAPIVEKDQPTVGPDAPIGKLKELFAKGKVAVVVENGRVNGIVTKIDMIDFLAEKVS